MRFVDRTTQVVTSPITVAHSILAERTSSRPLLDLSQAAPSYPPAPSVIEALRSGVSLDEASRYSPSPGRPDLRLAVANDLNQDHGSRLEAENVLITAGCNQAFCVVASSVAGRGDDIILAVPYYFNHDMWLKLDGIRPNYLAAGESGIPEVAETEKLIGPETRAILLVTPGNPTGAIYSPALIREFYDLAIAHDLVLIIDETYRTFRGTDDPSHDLYSIDGWRHHLVTLHSYSKDLAIPGYRVGAIVASPMLIAEALKPLDCVAICAPTLGQMGALAGLQDTDGWRKQQADRIGSRLEAFRSVMASEPGGFRLVSSGAFFGWVRHPLTGVPAMDVVRRLVHELDILVIPGDAFTPNDEGWLRFSFANLADEELSELGRRLETFA